MTQIIINETTPIVVEVSTPGPQGSSGTANVGTVTTGAAGSAAAVTNSGTPSAAVFNFTIPRGDVGDVTPAATAAKNAAEAAAIAAAASATAAQSSSTSASASATSAQSSATSASASAATATTKAQEATTSASNAAASAQSVSTAATTATTKAAEAAASATAALSSANTATTKAQEAAGSATTANTKAQEAVVSATTATNKATEASASAATALSAQQVTTDNATLAIAQANIASAKAAAANTSANDALVQASVATAQAAEATTQANTATTQAGIATAQATAASSSATTAVNAANTATAQATVASTKASEASASASNSQASATAAANAQTSASASASTATAQATLAGTARTAAETARDAAVVAQNNAVAVVTGGTATLTPSAGKIPLSDAQGKIAKGWLTNTDLVEQTDIGTAPNEIPLNQFLGEMAYMDAQNIPTLGISVANANTANVTNLMQVTEISNAVPSLNLDFAKVKQLDPRITFTRASTGTYYDGKTVAKAEENLILQSQAFDNAAWTKSGATTVANSTTAPDGTLTADTFVESSGGTFHYVFAPYLTYIPSGSSIAASCYIKVNGRSLVQINIGNAQSVTFDLTSGAVGAQNNATGAITSAGSGWYRCVITAVTAGSGTSFQIYTGTGSSTFDYTGDGTSGLFLWGAQLEQRASATAYTPTTTQAVTNYIPVLLTAASGVPRFEHNPVTGESLGLEIEEQRTNLFIRSEEFDNAAWTKNNSTITVNTIVSPDGTLDADKLNETATTASFSCVAAPTMALNTTYTLSLYMKAAERNFGVLNIYTGATSCWTTYNLSTGVISTLGAGATGTITPVGNGWYRCTLTISTASSGTPNIGIWPAISNNVLTYTGTAGYGIYIWGAQLEAGAFPTSYIPTVASQVTRAADSAVMTGANFSSWYRQGEGTLYGEQVLGNIVQTNQPVVSIFSSVASGYLLVGQAVGGGSATGSALFVVNNGSSVAYIASASGIASIGSSLKSAAAYKVNDFAFTANAGSIGTSFLGLVPTVDRLQIGALQGIGTSNGTIRKITYYPQRLSNAELVEMTA